MGGGGGGEGIASVQAGEVGQGETEKDFNAKPVLGILFLSSRKPVKIFR